MSRQPTCAPYRLVSASACKRGWSSASIMVLVQRLDGTYDVDIIHQPRPEERALARVSKDGHRRDCACGHPSRRPREERGLLRLYVPSLAEATHPRCGSEGYPEWAGQSLKQGG